jgi:hypothetical protein
MSGRRPGTDEDRPENLFETLGASTSADTAQLRVLFRHMARRCHPDQNGDVERFQAVTKAWGVLHDRERRAIHRAQVESRRVVAHAATPPGGLVVPLWLAVGVVALIVVLCVATAALGHTLIVAMAVVLAVTLSVVTAILRSLLPLATRRF